MQESRHVIRQNCVSGILVIVKKANEFANEDPEFTKVCVSLCAFYFDFVFLIVLGGRCNLRNPAIRDIKKNVRFLLCVVLVTMQQKLRNKKKQK